jgi:hypothetical protein
LVFKIGGAAIDREIDITPAEMGNNRPITTRAGQTIQYSVKERSQCLENDRFLITKKVNVAALPDTMKK